MFNKESQFPTSNYPNGWIWSPALRAPCGAELPGGGEYLKMRRSDEEEGRISNLYLFISWRSLYQIKDLFVINSFEFLIVYKGG